MKTNDLSGIEAVSQRICCLPEGFTPKILWEAWLPGCLSIFCQTGSSQSELALFTSTIRNIFSIGYASLLHLSPHTKQASHWLFLGLVVGCQKFMLEYTCLFAKDLVWFIGNFAVRDAIAARLRSVPSNLETAFHRACAVAAHLLRLESKTRRYATGAKVKEDEIAKSVGINRCVQVIRSHVCEISLRGYQRFHELNLAITPCLANVKPSGIRWISAHRNLIASKLQDIRASSRIRRVNANNYSLILLNRHASLHAGEVLNKSLLFLGIVSCTSFEHALLLFATFKKQEDSTQHTHLMILSATHEFNCVLGQCSQIGMYTLRHLAQAICQYPNSCCRAAVLALLNVRTWYRFLGVACLSNIIGPLDNAVHFWDKWLSHSRLNLYGHIILVDISTQKPPPVGL